VELGSGPLMARFILFFRILPELGETGKKLEDFDEAAIRELMKKEASKPLLLLREE